MFGFCNVWVCLSLGFVMCGFVYVWVFNLWVFVCMGFVMCVCVCMCGFFNVWVFLCMDFFKGCVYVCLLVF